MTKTSEAYMSDNPNNTDDAGDATVGAASSARPKTVLAKTLPTERVSTEKQLSVLRAYAAASGHDKRPVSNDEVAAIYDGLAASSISLCNPFFADVGLLVPEGRKQRPSQAVFDYLHAYEWNPETAALKLGPVLAESWAAKTLTTRLAFRQLTKDETIGVLADESKATKGHRRNLEILLDFLSLSGAVRLEGGMVMKSATQSAPPAPTVGNVSEIPATPKQPMREKNQDDVEEFTIPIPLKKPAIITFPKDIDADDWTMVTTMMAAYMRRLKGFDAKP